MKSNFSRRYFLERIAIASTVLVTCPTIVFSQKTLKVLRFKVFGEDSLLSAIINESDKMLLVDDRISSNVIYVSESYQKSQKYIQEVLLSGKHLIVESTENNDSWIERCGELGNLLTIVERSSDPSRLFESAIYYEGKISEFADYQMVMILLSFLEQHTKPLNFKIKSEYKPLEIPVS